MPAYLFLFTGLRFSMNAAMPSERSSSAKDEWNRLRSTLMPSVRVVSKARLTASLAIAADRRDRRLAAPRDPVATDRREIAGEHVDETLRLHLLDVGTGGKGPLAAGHDDAADLVVGLEIVDRSRDLAKHAERQRIQHLRAVEPDDADRATALNIMALDNDVFECAHTHPAGKIV